MNWILGNIKESWLTLLGMITALWAGQKIPIFSRLYTDYMEFNEMMPIFDSKYLREQRYT